MSKKKYRESAEQFIEKMGILGEGDHLPRIAGRLMGLLLLEGGPFSFSELAERLQVSRASVSTNIRLLQQLGVAERVARPGDRQDYYQIASQPCAQMLDQVVLQKKRISEATQTVLDALPETQREARERLSRFMAYQDTAITLLGSLQRFVDENR